MKVRICQDVEIDTEVNVDVGEFLAELSARSSESPREHVWVIDAATRIMESLGVAPLNAHCGRTDGDYQKAADLLYSRLKPFIEWCEKYRTRKDGDQCSTQKS